MEIVAALLQHGAKINQKVAEQEDTPLESFFVPFALSAQLSS